VAESKVQKVARQGGAHAVVGTCACGGQLTWAKLVLNRTRMVKVCVSCGATEEKGRS